MDFLKKIPSIHEVIARYPLNREYERAKSKRDSEIRSIFEGKSDKFLLIVGPCSADRENTVLDYMQRLYRLQEQVKREFLILPRIYTSKPRTIGDGYKGLLHQPFINREEDIVSSILAVRQLHKKVIEETGMSGADEMLYSETIGYFSDLLSYVAIGARSVENQQHRLTASGLKIPVGMKNPISGDTTIMLNSIVTAQHPHHFIYHGWEVISHGNELAHGILRGYTDFKGNVTPNYSLDDISHALELYAQRNVENMALIIDCNHGNSNKDYLKQIEIAFDVLKSKKKDTIINKTVKGLMIESYIEDGCQPTNGAVYGKSITDPCLGWNKTEKLILDLANEFNK